jgi:hypothetical protein
MNNESENEETIPLQHLRRLNVSPIYQIGAKVWQIQGNIGIVKTKFFSDS